MFDINTCKWIIWGARRPFNTFGYIHSAFERALQFMGKNVQWLEYDDDISQIDFSNTLFLSMNTVIRGMPRRQDCFYVIHNIFGDKNQRYFDDLKMLGTGVHITPNVYSKNVQVLGSDIYFESDNRSLQMRWGTDLLPHEIEANKPTKAFNSDSLLVNYIGTVDHQKMPSITRFAETCRQNGRIFNTYGGFNGGPQVTIDQHVRLIQNSYMAPALQGQDQVDTGYVSCRLFKNISAGQFGITQSKYANELFGGKLIFNENPVDLYYDARERLQSMDVKELHDLMDVVKRDHTYINKILAIETAIRTLENR
jgi:hypothetical protein